MSLFQHIKTLLQGESASSSHGIARELLKNLLAMAWFVEARDPYTGGHLWRVSRYARLLADCAELTEAEAARVSIGGFLHDLGKIGVPDAILRKRGALTDDEYAVMKTHPDVGLRILAGHLLQPLVRDAVGLHHERPDGRGYPNGLAAAAIPVAARIVGICDAFDAMTSARPYRAPLSHDEALRRLHEGMGRQFDAELTGQFIALGEAGVLDHIISHSDDGIPLQTCPMCGPTLVIKREHQAGDALFCRNCGGGFHLEATPEGVLAQPTGKTGAPADLEPELDVALIGRTLNAAASALLGLETE
jgi:response regulator RpfG family c-di-GMP phosphodiesterase